MNATSDSSAGQVLVLQHEPAERPCRVGDALDAAGLGQRVIMTPEGELAAVDIAAYRGLVVLGGSMGLGDVLTTPWLADEVRLIESAVYANVPVLGICLGSQLLAHVLGGGVTTGDWQLGWGEVSLTEAGQSDAVFGVLPTAFPALHWHHDWLVPPPSAEVLAIDAVGSDSRGCQAFRAGRSLGILCHVEADAQQIAAMASDFGEDLSAAEVSPADLRADTAARDAHASALAEALFGRWASTL
ncbi:MAG: type 1 glutamine amidotransferase [Candidatus Nanopelagicales bacterium]|nr:type 1 glutamine amidotransferase [Candidatus Nanopelagicales bacterium]